MLSFINTILTFWKQISKDRFIVGIMQYCGWAVGRRWPSNASKQFNFCVNFLSLTDNLTALTQIKSTPSPLCLEKLWHCTRMWDPRENYMRPKKLVIPSELARSLPIILLHSGARPNAGDTWSSLFLPPLVYLAVRFIVPAEDFHYIVHNCQQLTLAVTFSRYKSAGWTSWKGLACPVLTMLIISIIREQDE